MHGIASFSVTIAGVKARVKRAPTSRATLRVVAHGGVGGSGGPAYAGKDKEFGSDQAPWKKKLILHERRPGGPGSELRQVRRQALDPLLPPAQVSTDSGFGGGAARARGLVRRLGRARGSSPSASAARGRPPAAASDAAPTASSTTRTTSIRTRTAAAARRGRRRPRTRSPRTAGSAAAPPRPRPRRATAAAAAGAPAARPRASSAAATASSTTRTTTIRTTTRRRDAPRIKSETGGARASTATDE